MEMEKELNALLETMSDIIECQTNIIEILCSPIVKQSDDTPDWVTHIFD